VSLALSRVKTADSPTAIDLFSGAGGTSLGLEWAGFDLRLAVDSDPRKANWISRNHPNLPVLGMEGSSGDVRALDGRMLLAAAGLQKGELDLLVGCPPCQGYSLLGNRRIVDRRNYLYRHFIRLVTQMEPRSFGFENVPGILTAGGGRFASDLIGSLEDLGYTVTAGLLNASRFGVPQARERFIALGSVEAEPRLPSGADTFVRSGPAIADLPTRSLVLGEVTSVEICYRGEPRSKYARVMRGGRVGVANCEVTQHLPELRRRFEALGPGGVDAKTRHRRIDPESLAPTLTAGTPDRTACRPVHPSENRVLTVREAARLTSFPDWYAFPRQIAEAWSHIGNAVPPLMARDVFRPMWRALQAS
jgi:DNA (cytosine-5)-methyltransferase 1